MARQHDQALKAMKEVLGPDHLFTDEDELQKYSLNMLTVDNIVPSAIALPGSVADVQELLRIANIFKTPVWPISGGQNHGYGIACAANPGTVIIDLKRMNKILEVNADLAYALVEPGVTYEQLYEHLKTNDIPAVDRLPQR